MAEEALAHTSTEEDLFHIHAAVVAGKTPDEVPKHDLNPLKNFVLGAVCGPLSGLCDLTMEQPPSAQCDSSDESDELDGDDAIEISKPKPNTSEVADIVAGISNWNGPIKQADGDSITLYDHNPNGDGRRCDPIADVYAVVARPNNAILAIASGCNPGPKSRQAARCAVRGCVEKLNDTLFADSSPNNTQELTARIVSSFNAARELIVKHEGGPVSLCVAVVCPLRKHWEEYEMGLCVVSVGNVSCFVWKNRHGVVREVTSTALHDVANKGSLGPTTHDEPNGSSPVCSYVHVSRNDVVFLATKGIYENFDPFVLLDVAQTQVGGMNPAVAVGQDPPPHTSKEKENRKLSELTELLKKCRAHRKSDHVSALALKEALIRHVMAVTEEKRSFLERSWQDIKYADMLTDEEKTAKVKEVLHLAEGHPGFLGHATVVAYQVGLLTERASHNRTNLFLYSPTIDYETVEDGDI